VGTRSRAQDTSTSMPWSELASSQASPIGHAQAARPKIISSEDGLSCLQGRSVLRKASARSCKALEIRHNLPI
jgi:hypothetical protein